MRLILVATILAAVVIVLARRRPPQPEPVELLIWSDPYLARLLEGIDCE